MNTFLENQNWRYATKKYDTTKKISTENLHLLKEAVRLSSSSYGLQPYKIIIVENLELRAKLQPQSWGQSQIIEASHLFVFANDINLGDKAVSDYIKNIAETRAISQESLTGFNKTMKANIAGLPQDHKHAWTAKQTYLALGNLLNAAAELKIDATPMEGFNSVAYNEILGLNKLGLNACLVATLGYRHEEDTTQYLKKVRKSQEDLFIIL